MLMRSWARYLCREAVPVRTAFDDRRSGTSSNITSSDSPCRGTLLSLRTNARRLYGSFSSMASTYKSSQLLPLLFILRLRHFAPYQLGMHLRGKSCAWQTRSNQEFATVPLHQPSICREAVARRPSFLVLPSQAELNC